MYRPSLVPDRIVLTWAGDPATTQAVTWRTSTAASATVAQIAVAEDGPLFVPRAQRVEGTRENLTSDLGDATYHSVRFTGLKPATKYVYRVGDGVNWSEWIQFSTASDKPEPFSFIYFGDAQNDVRSHWSRVIREAHSDAPRARFMIHAGDLINRANRDGEWGEWFGAGGWLNAMLPNVPSPGNHEHEGGQLSRHWRPQFTLPENGLPSLPETNYVLDYQGVRIISLDSNKQHEEQAKWLDQTLAQTRANWVVVTFHHPVFNSARGRDNARLRELWKPIFDKYRVDLVLQGHDHTYARGHFTNVPSGVNARSEAGTVYVVSVSGPKMYDLERESWMDRAAEDTQLYQVIHVEPKRLRYEAKTVTGTLYDAFTLEKRPGRSNRLIEQKPKTPERLRPRGSGR